MRYNRFTKATDESVKTKNNKNKRAKLLTVLTLFIKSQELSHRVVIDASAMNGRRENQNHIDTQS